MSDPHTVRMRRVRIRQRTIPMELSSEEIPLSNRAAYGLRRSLDKAQPVFARHTTTSKDHCFSMVANWRHGKRPLKVLIRSYLPPQVEAIAALVLECTHDTVIRACIRPHLRTPYGP